MKVKKTQNSKKSLENSKSTMSSKPIPNSVYQIAGLDERDRGFNRQCQIIVEDEACIARLRYETLQIESKAVPSEEEALDSLIHALQDRGYRQMRSQRIFQGAKYLGNQELWVDYPDPELSESQPVSWCMRVRHFLGLGNT